MVILFKTEPRQTCGYSYQYISRNYTYHFVVFFLVDALSLLQSANPRIDIVFLLYILHFILIIGDIETNPIAESDSLYSCPIC